MRPIKQVATAALISALVRGIEYGGIQNAIRPVRLLAALSQCQQFISIRHNH